MALRSALRYALAGATGAAEGYGAKQQRLQQEEQRRLAQERQARQDQLDMEEKMAGLLSSGFMPEEEAVSRQQAARSAIGSAIGSALASAEGRVLAPPSEDGLRLAAQGAAGYNTGRRASFGGQTFVLPETAAERTERTERTKKQMDLQLEREERDRLQKIAQAAAKGGRGSAAFAQLAVENPAAANALVEREYTGPGFANLDFRRFQYEQEQERLKDVAEAWWNSTMRSADAKAAGERFRALRSANPQADPRDILLAIYQASLGDTKTGNTQARTENTQARTEKLRNPRNRPPGVRAPAAGGTATPPGAAPRAPGAAPGPVRTPAKPAANAPAADPLDAAFDRFNKQR